MKQRVVNGKELRDNKEGVRVGARQRRAKVGKFGFVIVHELEECERKRCVNIRLWVYVCMLACMYVYGYGCMYVCSPVCMYARQRFVIVMYRYVALGESIKKQRV